MSSIRFEYTYPRELERAKTEKWPILIPIGTLEYHSTICPYGTDTLVAKGIIEKETLLMQPNRCNRAAVECMNNACYAVFKESPVAMMKAVKNETEIAGFETAMLSEGIAMVKLLNWLKPAVAAGDVH